MTRSRGRVTSARAARAIETMLESLPSCPPTRLYRFLGRELGAHPVTFLRYHRGDLKSVSRPQLKALERLGRKIERGEVRVPDSSRKASRRLKVVDDRVPSRVIIPLFDRAMQRLHLTERQVLYRCLSERTGLDSSTLHRYHSGQLSTAPSPVKQALEHLLAEAEGEVSPALYRSAGGVGVVPWMVYRSAIERLIHLGVYESRSTLFQDLGRALGRDPETLRKAYYDRRIRLVRREWCDQAAAMGDSLAYDPARTYAVGQRISHPDFGAGVVREKLHGRVIVVHFKDGGQIRLREGYQHDPFWERDAAYTWLSEAG